MREISVDTIKENIIELAIKSCCVMTNDVKAAFLRAKKSETSLTGKSIINSLLKNADIAKKKMMPLCQDTGMAVVFMDIGQDVHIVDGDLIEAINDGVAIGYERGYLRKSIVDDPLFLRKNTNNNTPAVIYTNIVPGDKLHITFGVKGFGSENKSRLKMLTPSDGLEGLKDFFIETIKLAGPNSCPPLVVGVGIGGTFEKAALLSKKAALRGIDSKNQNPLYADLEIELCNLANSLGIGPEGLGGRTTAFVVNIEYYPTHIAGLPVAININCHSARHYSVEL